LAVKLLQLASGIARLRLRLRNVRSQAEDSEKARLKKVNSIKKYLSRKAGRLYRQTAGFWNVLDTLGNVNICNYLSATRRFCHVP
jgi:hypothetical protein